MVAGLDIAGRTLACFPPAPPLDLRVLGTLPGFRLGRLRGGSAQAEGSSGASSRYWLFRLPPGFSAVCVTLRALVGGLRVCRSSMHRLHSDRPLYLVSWFLLKCAVGFSAWHTRHVTRVTGAGRSEGVSAV